ncbi:MAG: hypothetical protein HRT35_09230 [Algicola sp.]|nr:hypothetical protein [Algicola sp.]
MQLTTQRKIDFVISSILATAIYSTLSSIPFITKAFNQWAFFYRDLTSWVQFTIIVAGSAIGMRLLIRTGNYPADHGLHAPAHLAAHRFAPVLNAIIVSTLLLFSQMNLHKMAGSYATSLFVLGAILVGIVISSRALLTLLTSCFCFNSQEKAQRNVTTAPIKNKIQDKFERVKTAQLLAEKMLPSAAGVLKRQALIGPYGAGKSSVLNLVEEHIVQSKYGREWLFVRFNAWGRADESQNVQGLILDSIIDELAKIAAVASIKSIPQHYLAALRDLHSSTKVLSYFMSEGLTETEHLARLDRFLSHLGIKVCVFIEDIDRNKDAYDNCNTIAPLLDKLDHTLNVHFIFAIGYKLQLSAIISRITDYREDLPSLDCTHILKQFVKEKHQLAYDRGLTLFYESKHQNSWALAENRKYAFDKTAMNGVDILACITPLIDTPRTYVAVTTEVTTKWSALAGHFNFDDLLILTTLKHSEPAALDFIHQTIKALRYCPGDSHETLSKKWADIDKSDRFNDGVNALALVNHLFPK